MIRAKRRFTTRKFGSEHEKDSSRNSDRPDSVMFAVSAASEFKTAAGAHFNGSDPGQVVFEIDMIKDSCDGTLWELIGRNTHREL
jgi:hypothetical protein